MRVVVADLQFTKLSVKGSSGAQLVINRDRTRVATVQEAGRKQRVIEFGFDRPDDVHEGPFYDMIGSLAFSSDGRAVGYAALKAGTRVLVLGGREERLLEGELVGPLVVIPGSRGIGVITADSEGIFLHQAFMKEGDKNKRYDESGELVYSDDGSWHAYAARTGNKWFVVVNGAEGPAFDRVVTPSFNVDGKFLVYRAREDGKRFVVVADTNGRTIRQHPSYEQVFPVSFTADGTSVAYGVKDGNKLMWVVEKR
jgi:hypothetical protein